MKAKPRVLLLSATSGAGHVRAAQALERGLLARGDCVVEHIDALQHVSKLFQRVYDQAYIAMVRRAPQLMGVLYEGTDRPWLHPRRRLALDRLNTAPMIRLLKRIQPDLCVATHFLPAEIIAWLIAKRKLRARHAIAVTDYDVHAMWLCRKVDRYYLAIGEGPAGFTTTVADRRDCRKIRKNPAAFGGIRKAGRPSIFGLAKALPGGIHDRDGQVHGGGRLAGGQGRRVDDVGSAGAGAAHG